MPDPTSLTRVRSLLREHPVVDGHNDLAWEMRRQFGYDLDAYDLAARQDRTHTDLVRLREGGVGAQFWSVWVPPRLAGDAAVTATLEQVDFVRGLTARYADRLGPAGSAAQARAVFASGRTASMMGAEGGHQIACSLATLRMLYALGVRYLTLTHNANVPWADSATDVPVLGGLSRFGVEVVREMNRLGMLVDLSHVADGVMHDALEASAAPVIFSHSSARAVCDVTRNVPDEVLQRLPANGGVCLVTFVSDFVAPRTADWRTDMLAAAAADGLDVQDIESVIAFAARYRETHPKPEATLADVVAHVEHVREVAGVRHVGLGGDYDGTDDLPAGLTDVSGYPRLLAALADRGWSDADLAGLAGGNVLRAWEQADEVAAGLRATRAPSLATYEQLDGTPAPEG